MFDLNRQVRYGIRVLLRKPILTIIGVITLGLGIGANTAIFTFVNAILLEPVPFPHAESLVMAWAKKTDSDRQYRAAPATYLTWQNQTRSFDGLAAYKPWVVNLVGSGEPDRLIGYRTSPGFFQMLGAKFILGRGFLAEEGQAGQDREVVLSNGLWQRDFGARQNVVGETINLDGAAYRVVGVIAANYEWPTFADVWAPLVMTDAEQQERTVRSLFVVGRIQSGFSLSHAQSDMDIIAQNLARRYPDTHTGEGVNLIRLPGQFGDTVTKAFVLLLMGAVLFVLLIACSNVTNLLLADAMGRQREVAVRTHLGASRWQIVMQYLTESTLLASLGATLGLFIAFWGVHLLRATIPADQLRFIPGSGSMHLNGRGYVFALVCALIAGVAAGMAPALQSAKLDLSEVLRSGGWGATSSARSRAWQTCLVATEFALALVLLVGTGLMVKGFENLGSVQNLGFESDNVSTMDIRLAAGRKPHQVADLYQDILTRVQGLPGVQEAALIRGLPFSGDSSTSPFAIEGRPSLRLADMPRAAVEETSQSYFHAMRIPLIQGRTFVRGDDEGFEPVAVVSKSAMREYWSSKDPTGARIRIGSGTTAPWLKVIGVVGDVKQSWLDTTPPSIIYVHYRQSPSSTTAFVVRSTDANLIPSIRKEISRLDPTASIYSVKTMPQVVADMIAGIRVATGLMAIFGIIAMVLAAAGVYGMIAHTVSSRKREIGIRMAMGAEPGDVVRLFVMRALKLAAIGLGIGLPVAFAMSRLMSNTLFGVVTLDPFTFVAFILILTAVAVMGAYIPARRAAWVDPVVVLRYE